MKYLISKIVETKTKFHFKYINIFFKRIFSKYANLHLLIS